MKARPRSVENRVADALNAHFKLLGMTPVERIPVLGRTGPDLSINELKLVVDVKSRIEVPKALFFPLRVPFHFENMVAVRLVDLNRLWVPDGSAVPLDFSSKIVRGYLAHMEEWTAANVEGGISCVILHRPEMPIGSSVAIIYSNCRRRLYEYTTEYRNRNYELPTE